MNLMKLLVWVMTTLTFDYMTTVMNLMKLLVMGNDHSNLMKLLAFYVSKCAASKDAKHRNCKNFYNSATVQFNL